jgi:L-ascorbate metabolism protein UlaG (beta-lactamase superfamily)
MMLIQRLNWAGALIESGHSRILIDPVYNSPDSDLFGKPRLDFSTMEETGNVDAILITHLHSDHFDPDYLTQHFGQVPILVPAGTENAVKERGLQNVKGMSLGDTFKLGDWVVTASHSVDGLGDIQVSWIVNDGDKTIIHCGDTLWHGYWWQIEKEYGPFDAALLPINGPIVTEQGMTKSIQPICMNPEQAVSAAKLLKVSLMIPIHYGTFHNPPVYIETEDAQTRVIKAADQENLNVRILQHQEKVEL